MGKSVLERYAWVNYHETKATRRGDKISSDSQFTQAILSVYPYYCGRVGKDVFVSQVIPALTKKHNRDYIKMTREAISLIEKGALKNPQDLTRFFIEETRRRYN